MRILRNLFLVIGIWATTALGDSNLDIPFPFNCSTRVLCSSLRIKLPNENEQFNAQYVNYSKDALNFKLSNLKGHQLEMVIKGIEGNRFRVMIEEPDHHRYKLEHSLEKEPKVKSLKVDVNKDAVTAFDDNGNKVIVGLTPLDIKFYHNNVLETVLEGNRIIMENTKESQAFTFSVRFNEAKRLMGLHEHADSLALRHTVDFSIDPYRLRNTDYGTTRYDLNTTEAMYGSIPVIYGFGNATSGIFVHNAAEMFIDIDNHKKSAYFMVDGGTLDLFVLMGPSLTDTVRQYMDLTGKPHLPQLWALGYHQCRWAYNSTDDIMETIQSFDAHNFPLDVLWLDIEYTADRKWFTWNSTTFPDPVKLMNWVDQQGHRKLVPISDPHIKVDPNYKVYADCLKNDYFVRNADGTPMVAECWPGNSSWIDYLNPAARDYYANLHLFENFPSTSTLGGFWNDMNEPTLFDNLYERTFPFSTLHYGDVKHRDVHNIYGMLQTMSTHKGLMARDQGKLRPFILSRAYFAGSQRYANKWSGDNWGHFTDLRYSVPMALTSNLVGAAFYGADIPGFFGTASEELLIRWYEIGIWLPFFRAHAANGSPRREPYRFSNATQNILRDVMHFRYKHLPYWYTLFYEHSRTGDPIVRPLLYQYPEDEAGYDLNDEFLIGSDILVASVYESNATKVPVYFPGKNDFWFQETGNSLHAYRSGIWEDIKVDLTFIPVFYRSGSIMVRKSNVGRSTADNRDTPYVLTVIPQIHNGTSNNGTASGRIYIDDFESFEYVNKKKYTYVDIFYNGSHISTKPVDKDNDPSQFTMKIEKTFVYTLNHGLGDGSYHVLESTETSRGEPFKNIDLLKEPLALF